MLTPCSRALSCPAASRENALQCPGLPPTRCTTKGSSTVPCPNLLQAPPKSRRGGLASGCHAENAPPVSSSMLAGFTSTTFKARDADSVTPTPHCLQGCGVQARVPGRKSASTSVSSSMLAGFMSTTLKAWSLTSRCHRLTRRSSAEMKVSAVRAQRDAVDVVRVRGRVLPPAARRQHHLRAVHLGRGHTAPVQACAIVCHCRVFQGCAHLRAFHWHRVAGDSTTSVLATWASAHGACSGLLDARTAQLWCICCVPAPRRLHGPGKANACASAGAGARCLQPSKQHKSWRNFCAYSTSAAVTLLASAERVLRCITLGLTAAQPGRCLELSSTQCSLLLFPGHSMMLPLPVFGKYQAPT